MTPRTSAALPHPTEGRLHRPPEPWRLLRQAGLRARERKGRTPARRLSRAFARVVPAAAHPVPVSPANEAGRTPVALLLFRFSVRNPRIPDSFLLPSFDARQKPHDALGKDSAATCNGTGSPERITANAMKSSGRPAHPTPGSTKPRFLGRSSDSPSSFSGAFPRERSRTVACHRSRRAYSSGDCAGMSACITHEFTGFPFHPPRGRGARNPKTGSIVVPSTSWQQVRKPAVRKPAVWAR